MAEKARDIARGKLTRLEKEHMLSKAVVEVAKDIMDRVPEERFLGRGVDAIVAACTYAASRSHGVPMRLDEITEPLRTTPKDAGREYKDICRILGLRPPLVPLENYIARFSSALGLCAEAESRARDMARELAGSRLLAGRKRHTVAAGILYVASRAEGETLTQREVARVAGTGESVLTRWRKLIAGMDGAGTV